MQRYLLLSPLLYLVFTFQAAAQTNSANKYSQTVNGYTVHFSVFSSTSISADMAQRYNLIRAKDRVYINIAVVPEDKAFGGVRANVKGFATNLIQQRKDLDFQTIQEPNATYYLAPLRHTNNEVFHFTITVDPTGPTSPFDVKFTKELYVNP